MISIRAIWEKGGAYTDDENTPCLHVPILFVTKNWQIPKLQGNVLFQSVQEKSSFMEL